MEKESSKLKATINNNFMDRFKGKVNKVSRLGVNAVLFHGEENLVSCEHNSIRDPPIPTPTKLESKKSVILQPLP